MAQSVAERSETVTERAPCKSKCPATGARIAPPPPPDPTMPETNSPMTDERKDLLTMSGEELRDWWSARWVGELGSGDLAAFAALRDAIVTAARQSDEAGKREAAAYGERARALCFERHPRGKWVELKRACDACAADAASVEAESREVARKAWDAAWELASPKGESNQNVRNIMHTQWTRERDRYLDAHHPLPPRECVLSDGTRISHDPRNGPGTIKVTHASGECSAWFTPEEFAIVRRCYTSDDLTLASRFAAGVGR